MQDPDESRYEVYLMSGRAHIIKVMKVLMKFTARGLKESKDLVDNAPQLVVSGVIASDAEKLKAALVAAGATVEVLPV
ncbi:MAG TPA: ribosomal protein L7/L12 [Chthonomonadaceae bacterium]|nr:ribosomal protein L7/L12 [Chthonomonadaceae bacterium]